MVDVKGGVKVALLVARHHITLRDLHGQATGVSEHGEGGATLQKVTLHQLHRLAVGDRAVELEHSPILPILTAREGVGLLKGVVEAPNDLLTAIVILKGRGEGVIARALFCVPKNKAHLLTARVPVDAVTRRSHKLRGDQESGAVARRDLLCVGLLLTEWHALLTLKLPAHRRLRQDEVVTIIAQAHESACVDDHRYRLR